MVKIKEALLVWVQSIDLKSNYFLDVEIMYSKNGWSF